MSIHVIDTSILLDNPRSILSIKGEVLIPFCVVEELENNKTRDGSAGKNAREAIRLLESLRKYGDLQAGVKINEDIEVSVLEIEKKGSNDDTIIETAKVLKDKYKRKKVFLMTNDLAMRIKASSKGVLVEEVNIPTQLDIFTGVSELPATSALINRVFSDGRIEAGREDMKNFYPNQFVILKEGQQSALTRFRDGKFVLLPKKQKVFDVDPKSKEQEFAFNLLTDENVELVSLIGKAGCGKTFISLAAGLEQVLERRIYEKIIVIRPVISVSKEIGFLPGSVEEKMAPWIQPIVDNLTVLFGGNKKVAQTKMDDGTIEIEALSFIRGRSIPKAFIIVDEAQNLNLMELKTIITRLAEGSKIVLCGDINQIDTKSLDMFNNGLSQVIEKFKDQKIAGHMTLLKGVRSSLASLASDIL